MNKITDDLLYMKLLKKYIEHICYHEGVTYTSDVKIEYSNVKFTKKEIKILKDIASTI